MKNHSILDHTVAQENRIKTKIIFKKKMKNQLSNHTVAPENRIKNKIIF